MKSLYDRLLPEYRNLLDEKGVEASTLYELKNTYYVMDLKVSVLVDLRLLFVTYNLNFDLNNILDYFTQ